MGADSRRGVMGGQAAEAQVCAFVLCLCEGMVWRGGFLCVCFAGEGSEFLILGWGEAVRAAAATCTRLSFCAVRPPAPAPLHSLPDRSECPDASRCLRTGYSDVERPTCRGGSSTTRAAANTAACRFGAPVGRPPTARPAAPAPLHSVCFRSKCLHASLCHCIGHPRIDWISGLLSKQHQGVQAPTSTEHDR